MPWNDLGQSVAPLADAAGKVLRVNGVVLLSAIALFATTNTVLIILLSGSRMLYGLSSHGSLHNMFSKIHFRTKTPWVAIITIMVASILFVTMLFGRNGVRGQSIYIALFKMLGTGVISLAFYSYQPISQESVLLPSLYVSIFVVDVIYLTLLYRKSKESKISPWLRP